MTLFVLHMIETQAMSPLGVAYIVPAPIIGFLMFGVFVVNPNEGRVLQFFGRYVGTVKDHGLRWANPFYTKRRISLRVRNFETERSKVNDTDGNPTQQADQLSLRGDTEATAGKLQTEIQGRLHKAGVEVLEARITHLAYAPEIASAMLQRQQAGAIIAARTQIVEGAVSMVQMALDSLSSREIVELDEERKAAMVSNLLVVLCGDRGTQPVVNTGTLHQRCLPRRDLEHPSVPRFHRRPADVIRVLVSNGARDAFEYRTRLNTHELPLVALPVDAEHGAAILLRLERPAFPQPADRGAHEAGEDIDLPVVRRDPDATRPWRVQQLQLDGLNVVGEAPVRFGAGLQLARHERAAREDAIRTVGEALFRGGGEHRDQRDQQQASDDDQHPGN